MDLLEEKSVSQLALANLYKYFIQETHYELYKASIRNDVNGIARHNSKNIQQVSWKKRRLLRKYHCTEFGHIN